MVIDPPSQPDQAVEPRWALSGGTASAMCGPSTAERLPQPPAEALAGLLPPDVDLAAGHGLRNPQARAVWLGMVWGRLGRGDLAAAWFDRAESATLQPWIAAERGRLVRELGDHARAARYEEPALELADDPVDRAMLLLSLAADAVGFGRADLAAERLAAARVQLAVPASAARTALSATTSDDRESPAAPAPTGPRADRQWLRASWVAAEIALLTDRTPDTSDLPRLDDRGVLQVPDRYAAGSRFHLGKGLLFAGVVRDDVRLLSLALVHAPPALWWAVQLARGAAGVDCAEVAGSCAREAIVPLPG